MKKSRLNIPTGYIRGSEEDKKQKQKESKEQAIAEYLALLEKMKKNS